MCKGKKKVVAKQNCGHIFSNCSYICGNYGRNLLITL